MFSTYFAVEIIHLLNNEQKCELPNWKNAYIYDIYWCFLENENWNWLSLSYYVPPVIILDAKIIYKVHKWHKNFEMAQMFGLGISSGALRQSYSNMKGYHMITHHFAVSAKTEKGQCSVIPRDYDLDNGHLLDIIG